MTNSSHKPNKINKKTLIPLPLIDTSNKSMEIIIWVSTGKWFFGECAMLLLDPKAIVTTSCKMRSLSLLDARLSNERNEASTKKQEKS